MKQYFKFAMIMGLMTLMVFSLGVSQLSAKKLLPDLVITKIFTTRDCRLAVQVRNNGPGELPDNVWTSHRPKSAGVYVNINGKGWGGQSIWKFDPAKKLKRRGGMAVCVLNYRVGTAIKVKATVDQFNVVRERKESNNAKRAKLRCRGGGGSVKLPDLIVRDIRLIKNCKLQVTIRNIGQAGVPASYYNLPKAVGVQMYVNGKAWGGIILSGFDPAGKLKSPGGTATHTWFPKAQNLNLSSGVHSIKVMVDNNKVLHESRENNNTLMKRVKCKLLTLAPGTLTIKPVVSIAKAPARFMMDFKDAYLIYTKSTKSIQIAAEGNVLSYGSDWEKCQLKPYLFHIRQKVWKGFYWQVNTSRKEVYKVTGGSFCKVSGKKQKLQMTVVDSGASFTLRFPKATLVYVPASKILQVGTEQMVLTYGQDWKKCNVSNIIYHLRENFWRAFYWEINTLKKKAYRVKNGTFCKGGGSKIPLKASVRVVK